MGALTIIFSRACALSRGVYIALSQSPVVALMQISGMYEDEMAMDELSEEGED